jgi:hypothetical protein
MAIAVVRGDIGTGDPDVVPSTQHPRGKVTIERVAQNGFLPFYDVPPFAAPDPGETVVATWLLLHHRKGGELFCEMSFPTEINASGYVESWGERIILTPIQLDPARMPVSDEPAVNPDVTVRRRA